jgi:uncharacterized protein
MSEENVEVVRELYEAMDAGRLDPVLSFLDPEIEYVNPPDAIDPGTRHGIQGMVEAVANVTEPFESSAHTIEDIVPNGDKVLVTVTFRATGRGSGASAEQDEAHVWTFNEGKVVRFQWFHGRDQAKALKAAGLSE